MTAFKKRVLCQLADFWCAVDVTLLLQLAVDVTLLLLLGDFGLAGSKALSLSPHFQQPEGAPQGGWKWDWPWVSEPETYPFFRWTRQVINFFLFCRPGYASQHKQHQWQKTGHKVEKMCFLIFIFIAVKRLKLVLNAIFARNLFTYFWTFLAILLGWL